VRYVLSRMKRRYEHGVEPPDGLRDSDVAQREA
jgi:hypothetical protein